MGDQRLITPNDLTQLQFVSTPSLAPNGEHVVYTLTQTNTDLNGYESALWHIQPNERPTPLTTYHTDGKLIKEHSPIWNHDGKWIYFLSNRTEKQQVWCIPMSGGEAQQMTAFDEGVNGFVLSPKGKQLVCEISVSEKDAIEETNEDVVVIDRLRYMANGSGFIKTYTHLVLFDLETQETTALTSGQYNAKSPCFTPRGDAIIFLKSREAPELQGYFNDIYQLNLMTNEEVLLYKGKGSVYDPSVSPDGKWLAFCGHEGGEISPDNTGLWVLPLDTPTASPLQLTRHWDRPVGNYVGADASFDDGYEYKWNDDSQALTFITTVGGNCFLKQVNLKGEVSDVLSPENSVITSFDQNKERITFVKATPLSPGDIYLFSEEKTTPLTDHNQKLLESLLLAQPEHFSYTGAEGWEIEGWILLPPHSPKTKASIPVVLQIHGGPHTAYGNAFHHEFQCIAAEGYAVVYTNPRGSQGYGRAFTAACIGDWGKKDQEDILLGLDYALKHYQQLDPERQYVTGGSYGGFMTNTIITCTNRFKAAVTQRCISNMYSFFGTSDIGYFFAKGQLGEADLWKDEDAVLEVSPIRHARNVTTPTCIIHSEEDLRCPIEQAEQWYVALRRLGVDTRFVRFKGENHELSRSGKPKNRLTRLSEIIDWFNRYNSKKNK